ncbi:D-alanyl-D-alanine carboxypeptidase family protein [Paenibacillaceae bacterium]|nr:D-alanyl-D-alanine carboxypeptidase family protein [Paenibacillaceae bacterium]
MKKLMFGVAAALFVVGYGLITYQPPPEAVEDNLVDLQEETQDQQQQPEDTRPVLTIAQEEVYKGNLLLINRQHAVPKDVGIPDVVNLVQRQDLVEGFGILDNNVELPLDMLQKFTGMIEAAKEDGVSHFLINSGYRDNEKQDELYKEMGEGYANAPGHSEHNLGLSLDIGSALGLMKNAPEGEWLKHNAWKHGFILRYPEDKSDITGAVYEPWHFRYVGLPHSAIMQEHDFVLEEYLDYLKEERNVTAQWDGKMYTVSYYLIAKGQRIKIPIEGSYELSGNNTDGVIVTTWDDGASDGMEEEQ